LIVSSVKAQDWQLVWSDEFNGTTLDPTIWTPTVAGTGFGNKELEYYTSRPQNLKVENGHLVITSLLENYTVSTTSWKYTSARISSQNLKNVTYGKIEARLKLPKGAGLWPAFWTLGYGNWPACGEVDICEFQGSQPNQFQSNIHTKDYNGTLGNNFHLVKPYVNLTDSFHIYSIEWTAANIKFFFDGAEYWEFSSASVIPVDYPFTGPMYIILNLAVGGTMGGAVDTTIFPQQMLVDYIRVYQDISMGLNQQFSKDNPIISSFFSNDINITFPDSYQTKKLLSVFDINGKSVLKGQTSDKSIDINSGSLIKGIYLVRIVSGDKTYTQKVIKK